MRSTKPRPETRSTPQDGPIQHARRRVETFVAAEGTIWAVLYVLAGLAALCFLVVILNMSAGSL